MQTKGLLPGLGKSNQPKIQWQHTFNLEHCQLEQPGKHRSALLQFLQRNILSPSIIFKKNPTVKFLSFFLLQIKVLKSINQKRRNKSLDANYLVD